MKLRKKIIIFIGAVAVLGIGATYLLLHIILLNRFDNLDKEQLQRNLNRAVESYNKQLQEMRTGLLNYSLRDETYRFIESGTGSAAADSGAAAFIRSSFTPATYEINRFDMIALLDLNGNALYGGSYDSSLGSVTPSTQEQLSLFRLIHSRLPALKDARDSRSGIVNLDKGPMLITLTPIVNRSKDKPVIGLAVAGRMLHQDEITQIWDDSFSSIRISRITQPLLAESNGQRVWSGPATGSLMSAHTLVDDLFGDPGIIISLKEPRQMYNYTQKSLGIYRLLYSAAMLLVLAASLLFVNRFILRRMSSLVSNIRDIGSSKDLSIRIASSGRDEFSEVEIEFNRMLDSLEQVQNELLKQSMLDPLTQLPNRSLFFAELNDAIASVQGLGRQLVLVFIDLDHFKTVNDTLGHDFGDAILKETAFRLTQVVGRKDIVSRLGGDEFTILLSDVPDTASTNAQLARIQEALSMPHRIKGHLLYNTASIGISIYPQNGEDADDLVKQADLAMFHVKETGRNNVYRYSEELEAGIRRKKVLSQLLLSAAAAGEFEVHYQPILGAQNLQVSKVEALLRWNSGSYGHVSPAEFIPLAESSGSIIGIGGWVLRQVCSDMREFRRRGLQLTAAVNISALQLMQPGLLELLLELLQEFELPASSLELEITESVLVSGDSIFRSLQQLRCHGFRISLDDFGTGFSSLSYLRRFPVDIIKIDRSFVSELSPAPQADVLVKAIIELSHNLGLRVVSEGIEQEEQLDMLRAMGSDELQGYYISRPLQTAALYSFLAQENYFHKSK
ncbi:EAL domain-containing protein [Paenibacillus sp. MMS20-IR301]|uniref:bifunctional diguanylate cyclase/phosphodiesterase n=1 Tax=Paenibacillus sp. MMS20-IR301 TaxID=2895946 RepID=UPI0028EA4657|nr:EAL domain-containing protein [Paenibacillus sp. MMS20-IR301]WNS42539.1 EAL domain-containing protein [Paenibacillus sp. MMS20-IR301]